MIDLIDPFAQSKYLDLLNPVFLFQVIELRNSDFDLLVIIDKPGKPDKYQNSKGEEEGNQTMMNLYFSYLF